VYRPKHSGDCGPLPICLILIIYAAALSLLLPMAQMGFCDIAIGLPLLLQEIMFRACAVLDAIPEHWRAVYTLNPLELLVEAFRGALVSKQIISAEQLGCGPWADSAPNGAFRIQNGRTGHG
jgi:lipopolysaccharide transport system permease protein